MKLTDRFLRTYKFDGKQRRIFDDHLPNFGIRTYKSGIRFIVLKGNERKSITIGRHPHMSLKDARTEALRLLQADHQNTTDLSVSNALSDFFFHADQTTKPRTASDYKRLLNKHFPPGTLQKLSRSQILASLEKLKHRPGERSHAHTAFHVFLNWCVHNGYLEINPIAGMRNQGRIERRDRVLSDEEIKALWDNLGDDRFDNIMRILILTGLRRGEVQHITLHGDTATIPARFTKNGIEHNFPLGPLSSQYVQPIIFNGWGKSKKRLDTKAGVSDYRIHDLRRTFATNHAKLGTPIHVVEKLLNHISGSMAGVAGIYNRHSYADEMREACIRYEEWLSSSVLGH